MASDKTNLNVAKIFKPLPDDKIVYLSKVKKLVNDKLGGHQPITRQQNFRLVLIQGDYRQQMIVYLK